jgi:predicted transcriptional regulator of viral defense system
MSPLKQTECVKVLAGTGRRVFLKRDLARLLGHGGDVATDKTVSRLVSSGLLERVCRGVYRFPLAPPVPGVADVYLVASALRRGQYVFESLETAASEYGLISQVPLGALTLMTTGREGTFDTACGTIEFVHTKASVPEILANTVARPRCPVRVATEDYVVRNLRRCGRGADLLREARQP